jgi:hypothetical protein
LPYYFEDDKLREYLQDHFLSFPLCHDQKNTTHNEVKLLELELEEVACHAKKNCQRYRLAQGKIQLEKVTQQKYMRSCKRQPLIGLKEKEVDTNMINNTYNNILLSSTSICDGETSLSEKMKPFNVPLVHNLQFETQKQRKELILIDTHSMFLYDNSNSIREPIPHKFVMHNQNIGELMGEASIHSKIVFMNNNAMDEVG